MKRLLSFFVIISLFAGCVFMQTKFKKVTIFDDSYVEQVSLPSLSDVSNVFALGNVGLKKTIAFVLFQAHIMSATAVGIDADLNNPKVMAFAKEAVNMDNYYPFQRFLMLISVVGDNVSEKTRKTYESMLLDSVAKKGNENPEQIAFRKYFEKPLAKSCGGKEYELNKQLWQIYLFTATRELKSGDKNLAACLYLHAGYQADLSGWYLGAIAAYRDAGDLEGVRSVAEGTKKLFFEQDIDHGSTSLSDELAKLNKAQADAMSAAIIIKKRNAHE